jgi:hypothetical protein
MQTIDTMAMNYFEVLFFLPLRFITREGKKMGRKRLERRSVESLFSTVSSMLVPAHILEYFEIWDAHEYSDRWLIEMREKEGLIPKELSSCPDVVLDGYCNAIETLSHSFVCKPVYLRLFRRRYKVSTGDIHFSNDYDVSLKGVKMVPEMGFFLKETH